MLAHVTPDLTQLYISTCPVDSLHASEALSHQECKFSVARDMHPRSRVTSAADCGRVPGKEHHNHRKNKAGGLTFAYSMTAGKPLHSTTMSL